MLKNWCLTLLIRVMMCFILKLATLFMARIEAQDLHRVLKFSQSQLLKSYVEFNTQKRIEAEKNSD